MQIKLGHKVRFKYDQSSKFPPGVYIGRIIAIANSRNDHFLCQTLEDLSNNKLKYVSNSWPIELRLWEKEIIDLETNVVGIFNQNIIEIIACKLCAK